MQLLRFASPVVLTLALAAGSASPAAAQSTVTTTEIQRLQDSIYDASRAISQLRSRDASAASQMQADLDDAADEAIYLKVKLRKNEPVSQREYADVRDRVDNIRDRARGDLNRNNDYRNGTSRGAIDNDRPVSGASTSPNDSRYPADNRYPSSPAENRYPADNTVRSQNPNEIPVGTEFDVRLQNQLSSKTSQVEDRFEATTMVDLLDERGRVLVPSGSVCAGWSAR